MKKYNLHQQLLTLLVALVMLAACSKKNYLAKDTSAAGDKFNNVATNTPVNNYTPPPVITLPDEQAKSNRDGELYYYNEYGYRYWRFFDGKYYLDTKYKPGTKPGKKYAKKNRKESKKQQKKKKGEAAATQ
jgi:hypothetical protein